VALNKPKRLGPDPAGSEYVTARDIAELLQIRTTDTIHKMASRGLLPPPTRLGRNVRRWRRATVLAFLAAREAAAEEGGAV
jgi:predicted DNA-binding transcriptional regulator AlpA